MKSKKVYLTIFSLFIVLLVGGAYLLLDTETQDTGEITHNLQSTIQPGIEQINVESETGDPIENAEVYINGTNQGQTDETGTANLEIPQGEFNLRIEYRDQEITSQHQTVDYENHGIYINEEELNPGEEITIRVFYQDRHLSEGEVRINGRSIGETNSIGRIETVVPEEQSMNIEVPDEGFTKQRTINLEEQESDETEEDTDDLNQGQLQTQIDTEDVQIGDTRTLTVENAENQSQANVEIELNNQSIGQTGEDGQINVEFQQAGENTLKILPENQESIEKTIDVEDTNQEQELEIRTITQPIEGEEVQFEIVYNDEPVEAELYIDDEPKGMHQNYTYTLDEEITVEAVYDDNIIGIDLITPVSEFEITKNSPNADEVYNQNEVLTYEFEIDEIRSEEANYTLELEHTEITRDLEKGQTSISHQENASETISLTIDTPNIRTSIDEQLQLIEGDTENQPIFSLQSPTNELETFEDQKEVTFEYHVENTGWADTATIEIEDEGYENQRQISSGVTYTDFRFELPSDESGKEYLWTLTLEDEEEDNARQKEATFELTKVEPEENAALTNVDVKDNGYEVEFDFQADSEKEKDVQLYIEGEHNEGVYYENSERDSPFDETYNVNRFIEQSGDYTAYIRLIDPDTEEISYTSVSQEFSTISDYDGGGDTD